MSHWKLYPDQKYYFVTTSITQWIPLFTDTKYFSIITNSLSYCVENKDLRLHAYVIMLNHIHLLVSVKKGGVYNLSGIMRDSKRHTSNEITKELEKDEKTDLLKVLNEAAIEDDKGNNYKVWQSGFHPIAIESEKFCRQKVEYIHENPVRKGYVVEPEHWFYSSARNYSGLVNVPLEIELLL